MPDLPRLAVIQIHPIKALDGVTVPACRIGPGGGLEFDRVWALHTGDGACINGKRTPAVHGIRAVFEPDLSAVALSVRGSRTGPATRTFAFPHEHASAASWFSEYFGHPVAVHHAPEGMPDDSVRNGPMVVSSATLRSVAAWFPELDVDELRRRLRTPLEIDGVDAFWEDRLYREREDPGVRFRVGEVELEGVNPCPRCVVTARDSRTGADTPGFQKRFTEQRKASLPPWARRPERVQHHFHLGVNTRVAPTEHGKWLRVGDAVG
jgi:uncharacterized protein